MNAINRYPERLCSTCKKSEWWFRQREADMPATSAIPAGTGEWVCGNCHPLADPLIKLKYRIIKGNYKLFIAIEAIAHMEVGEVRDEPLARYNAAAAKLRELCDELKGKGVTACLYISEGKKMQRCLSDNDFRCTVCPNDYWAEKELLEIDQGDYPEEY